MSSCLIFDMSTSQFPFGEYPTHDYGDRKVLIRKRMEYRTERECKIMTDKLDILTKICHRNVINVRSVDKSEEGAINIFYPYVSHGL